MVDIPPDLAWTGGTFIAARAVFGGAVEEVNEAIRRWTEYRLRNVGRVTDNAALKLGSRLNDPGAVPPRVALRILEEGSLSDDEIVVEYLGGVLASSKTREGRDDRGNTLAALISRLSAYDLRAHYVWYATISMLCRDLNINPFAVRDRTNKCATFMSYTEWDTAMEFSAEELTSADHIFAHALHWLKREELIGFRVAGDREHVSASLGQPVPTDGMIVAPTVPGLELFLWAHGRGHASLRSIFDSESVVTPFPGVELPMQAVRVADLPQADTVEGNERS